MTSAKNPKTSKSGKSGSSTRRAGRSSRSSQSSQTASASFEQVFGKGEHPHAPRLRVLLDEAEKRLAAHKALTVPVIALFKTRHHQRLATLTRHVRNLREAIESLTPT